VKLISAQHKLIIFINHYYYYYIVCRFLNLNVNQGIISFQNKFCQCSETLHVYVSGKWFLSEKPNISGYTTTLNQEQ